MDGFDVMLGEGVEQRVKLIQKGFIKSVFLKKRRNNPVS